MPTTRNADLVRGPVRLLHSSSGLWLLLAVALLAGCHPGTPSLNVLVLQPAALTTGVDARPEVSAVFSEALDPATVGPDSLRVLDGAEPAAGTVTYDAAAHRLIWQALAPLPLGATVTASLSPALRGTGGASGRAVTWSFTVIDGEFSAPEMLGPVANDVQLFAARTAAGSTIAYGTTVWERDTVWTPTVIPVDRIEGLHQLDNGDAAVLGQDSYPDHYELMLARRPAGLTWQPPGLAGGVVRDPTAGPLASGRLRGNQSGELIATLVRPGWSGCLCWYAHYHIGHLTQPQWTQLGEVSDGRSGWITGAGSVSWGTPLLRGAFTLYWLAPGSGAPIVAWWHGILPGITAWVLGADETDAAFLASNGDGIEPPRVRRFVDGAIVEPILDLPGDAALSPGAVAPRGDAFVRYTSAGQNLARRYDPNTNSWQEPVAWPEPTVALACSVGGTLWSVHKEALTAGGERLQVQRWRPDRAPEAPRPAVTAASFGQVAIAADDRGRAVLVFEILSGTGIGLQAVLFE